MDTTAMISSLVETFKELNMKYRGVGDSPEVLKVVTRMRDDEIMFSKALKDRLTGIGTASEGGMGDASDIVEGSSENVAQVISQFGSARATTLNLLKGITDQSVWTRNLEDGTTLQQRVDELVRSDDGQLQKLASITG